jgi:Carboxypeptidase regulatory-like domain
MLRTRLQWGLLAGLAALLAVVWLVLPALRRANPTFVAHSDPAAAAVTGTVVDADGKPVAGVEVTWFAVQGDMIGMLGTRAFMGGKEYVVTAADGSFRFAAVPAVDGYAAIRGSRPRWEGRTGELTPRAGFVAAELQLVAEPIPPSRLLRGTLRDPDGKPVPFVPIVAKGSRWLTNVQYPAVTDAEGRFEFVWPWAGEFELSLQGTGTGEHPLGTATCGDITLTASR